MDNHSQQPHDKLESHWQTTQLPALDVDELSDCQWLQYPTQEVIIKQGQRLTSLYFVVEGVLREQQIDPQGALTSKGLYSEGDWLMSLSHLSSPVSESLIESVTPCQLIELPIALVNAWRTTQNRKWPALLERYCQQLEQRKQLQNLDSQAVYQSLLLRYPDLATWFTAEQCQQSLSA